MFKLSRNNAGDAKDVAALRAAVFDELTGLWSKSAEGIAKDSLKLGGKEAALYALLTSTVAAANKLASAKTINGVEFDGTADISIDHLVDHVLQSSVKAEILAAMNDPVGVFRTFSGPAGLTDAPTYSMMWRYIAFRYPNGNLHVIALIPGGLYRLECVYDCQALTWGNWVETQTSTGMAPAVSDNQSSRIIWVKSGRVIITSSIGAVTFASAFPNQLLFATYHLESSGPFLAATGTTAGIQLVASTSGTYNWIAWGY